MSIEENIHPTRHYVHGLLIDMIESSQPRRVLSRSAPMILLPGIPGQPPVWAHVRNRLKILCGIDHIIPLESVTTGQFKFVYLQELASEDLSHHCVVEAIFDDGASDPSVTLQLEQEVTLRGPPSLKR